MENKVEVPKISENTLSPHMIMTLKDCEGVLALCEEEGRVLPEALDEIRTIFGKVKELLDGIRNEGANEKEVARQILTELEKIIQMIRDGKYMSRSAVSGPTER
ncbi:MAG: hypothetical protein ACOYS2_00915, partial [Patescibacteria group bacterium]